MSSTVLLDICGRRRSPATLSSFHQGRPPRNKGQRYPADPPTVEEIIEVMHAASDDADAVRLRGLIVVLWRAGLRISEALALCESDLDPVRVAILVRRGKGGKRRESRDGPVGLGPAGSLLHLRAELPVGALFCCAAPHAVAVGHPPAFALNSTPRPQEPACDAGSRRTSYVVPTR